MLPVYNPNDATPPAVQAAVTRAIERWRDILFDHEASLVIEVRWVGTLGGGVLGQTPPTTDVRGFDAVRDSLLAQNAFYQEAQYEFDVYDAFPLGQTIPARFPGVGVQSVSSVLLPRSLTWALNVNAGPLDPAF
jgi:hypothetical protein